MTRRLACVAFIILLCFGYQGCLTAELNSRSRIEWAASLNEDDCIRFTAVGLSSRTLLVTIFPTDRAAEDGLESEILYDGDARGFRKELLSRGFTSIRVGSVATRPLRKETHGQAAAVASGRV
jgi:hypothetical protein